MVKSMTGYGKIFKSYNDFDALVEIKTVNGKYFDPSFRTPKSVSSLEITARGPLQEIIVRGKTDIRVEISMKAALRTPVLNKDLFRSYGEIIETIRREGGIDEEPRLEHYLRMPDIIEFKNDEKIEKEMEEKVAECMLLCAQKLDEMRIKEGAALEKDISARLERLSCHLELIERSKEGVFAYWFEKFKKRMEDMELSPLEERIAQEASVYGEKADIAEETTRLRCHIDQFREILAKEYPAGKKLDFLSQELHRELNTIASKSARSDIIGAVIEAKAETDRIREQVQNIV